MKDILKKFLKLKKIYRFLIFTLIHGTLILIYVKLMYDDLHYGILISYFIGIISSFFAVYVNPFSRNM